MDTKQHPVEDKIEKPASRWRNWFVAPRDGYSLSLQKNIPKGTTYCDPSVYPSKDMAETDHFRIEDANKRNVAAYESSRWLGAFPEGQDAP